MCGLSPPGYKRVYSSFKDRIFISSKKKGKGEVQNVRGDNVHYLITRIIIFLEALAVGFDFYLIGHKHITQPPLDARKCGKLHFYQHIV